MGTLYYVQCLDCKKYAHLDKFHCAGAAFYDGSRAPNVRRAYLDWSEKGKLKNEQWSFDLRSWLLLAFLGRHHGHRIAFGNEHYYPMPGNEEYDLANYTDEFPDAWERCDGE